MDSRKLAGTSSGSVVASIVHHVTSCPGVSHEGRDVRASIPSHTQNLIFYILWPFCVIVSMLLHLVYVYTHTKYLFNTSPGFILYKSSKWHLEECWKIHLYFICKVCLIRIFSLACIFVRTFINLLKCLWRCYPILLMLELHLSSSSSHLGGRFMPRGGVCI